MNKHIRLMMVSLLSCITTFSAMGSEELEDTVQLNAAGVPVIEVYGNGYLIENGAASPVGYNLTDFGYEYVGERHTHWFTIENAGTADLVLNGPLFVSIVGTDTRHFEVRAQPASSTIAPGGTTTFAIAFEPDFYGEVGVTVQIYSNDTSQSPYSFLIKGGDEDDDNIRWYARCGVADNNSWLLPIAILIALMLVKRFTGVSASQR